jgi:hypothetical protein
MPRKARIDAPGALHHIIVRGIDPEQVWTAGKHPITVKARSLMCYWAVRRLDFSATELSKKLGVSQPSVSISVKRGEKIAKTMQLELIKD